MLGRNNGGAETVVGKSENSIPNVYKEVEDALRYNLTILPGPTASVPVTVGYAGDRGRGERLLS